MIGKHGKFGNISILNSNKGSTCYFLRREVTLRQKGGNFGTGLYRFNCFCSINQCRSVQWQMNWKALNSLNSDWYRAVHVKALVDSLSLEDIIHWKPVNLNDKSKSKSRKFLFKVQGFPTTIIM